MTVVSIRSDVRKLPSIGSRFVTAHRGQEATSAAASNAAARTTATIKAAQISAALETLWMQRLLREADRAAAAGEVPVAAVVLDAAGRCIGWGRNQREQERDPFGHAELVALRQAAKLLGDWRFHGCTLLVTLEPCPMCAGTLVQARMERVVFAADDPKRGALGGCLDLANHPSAHHRMAVKGGVLAEEARTQLQRWFRQRRQRRDRPGS